MQGLPTDEKSLLLRVGELIDAAINNRTPTNPNTKGRTRIDRKLPPPSVITHETGIRSAKLTWPAVNSSILLHYKIVVTNMDGEGTTETFISYTNTFFFKGRKGGNYKALIHSVGRNDTQSPPVSIDFYVTEDVMLLEGARNDFNTIGTLVNHTIYHNTGHVIFAWCSFTLDRLIGAASTGNNSCTANLYRADPKKPFSSAVLLQSVPLFQATESATNLDNTALGVGIIRPGLDPPASTDLDYARGTTFETCFAFMFAPIPVTTETAEKNLTYWLEIVGREVENDVASLSLPMWSANEGESDQIPSNIPDASEPAVVEFDNRAVEMHLSTIGQGQSNIADEYLRGRVPANFRSISDHWTFACWIKWLAWPEIGQTSTIFNSFSPQQDINNRSFNAINIILQRNTGASGLLLTRVSIGGGRTDPSDLAPATGAWAKNDFYQNQNPSQLDDIDLADWNAGSQNVIWPLGLDEWYFFICDYDNVNGINVYNPQNGFNTFTPNSNSTIGLDPPPNLKDPRDVVFGCDANALYFTTGDRSLYRGPTSKGNQPAVCRIHSAGMWNARLTQTEMSYLYNGLDGVKGPAGTIHWLNNSLGGPHTYEKGQNLIHYWQMGIVSSELKYVARDTGFNQLGSGGVPGGGDIDCSEDGEINTDFTVVQNVVADFPNGPGS